MVVTESTELTPKVTMFADGANGYFLQRYNLYADGIETGVQFEVTGSKEEKTKRVFFANGYEFDGVREALEAAGHEWKR